jgi:hypothetical protein
LAFGWLEEIADASEGLLESIHGPDGPGAQMGLEFWERHHDWIDAGTAGRPEEDPCVFGLDRLLGSLAFMGREIDGVDAPSTASCARVAVFQATRKGGVHGKC